MLTEIKYLPFVAILLFIVSCTKTDENKNKNDVVVEKVANTHAEKIPHDHKDGELSIDPVASKVAKFSMEGKYQEAIDVLVAAKDVPGYQWDAKRLYDSIIYLNDKTKQYDKNLDVWRDGHSKGLIFMMDKTKKHFVPYLVLDDFDEIYERDLEMQKEIEKTK